MKATYKLEGLCCPNCAERVQTRVLEVKGVQSVKLTFMTQKMVVMVDDEVADTLLPQIEALIKDLAPKVKLARL